MSNVYVTPAKDAEGNALRVPDPHTGTVLPAGGAWKPRHQYWLRRIRAGDVTEGEPTAAPKVVEIATEPTTAEAAPAVTAATGK